jgi:hypothetical protein
MLNLLLEVAVDALSDFVLHTVAHFCCRPKAPKGQPKIGIGLI